MGSARARAPRESRRALGVRNRVAGRASDRQIPVRRKPGARQQAARDDAAVEAMLADGLQDRRARPSPHHPRDSHAELQSYLQ